MRLRLLTLGLAATVFAAGCSDDDDGGTGPTTEAGVRVVHASPDAPNVDVLVDDAQVLSAVPYLGSSSYLAVPSGTRNVKVNAAGTSTTVIDADLPLTAGTDYTVIAGGLVSDDRAAGAGRRSHRAAGRERQGAGGPRRAECSGGGYLCHGAGGRPSGGDPRPDQRSVRRGVRLPHGSGRRLPGSGDAGGQQDGGDRQRLVDAGRGADTYRDRGRQHGRRSAVRLSVVGGHELAGAGRLDSDGAAEQRGTFRYPTLMDFLGWMALAGGLLLIMALSSAYPPQPPDLHLGDLPGAGSRHRAGRVRPAPDRPAGRGGLVRTTDRSRGDRRPVRRRAEAAAAASGSGLDRGLAAGRADHAGDDPGQSRRAPSCCSTCRSRPR